MAVTNLSSALRENNPQLIDCYSDLLLIVLESVKGKIEDTAMEVIGAAVTWYGEHKLFDRAEFLLLSILDLLEAKAAPDNLQIDNTMEKIWQLQQLEQKFVKPNFALDLSEAIILMVSDSEPAQMLAESA